MTITAGGRDWQIDPHASDEALAARLGQFKERIARDQDAVETIETMLRRRAERRRRLGEADLDIDPSAERPAARVRSKAREDDDTPNISGSKLWVLAWTAAQADGLVRTKDVREHWDFTEDVIQQAVPKLAHKGCLEKVDTRTYRITDKGRRTVENQRRAGKEIQGPTR